MSSPSTWRSTASKYRSVADLLGRPATPEGAAKTYLEELMLYSYIENSFVGNLRTTGRGDVNELRFYDHDNGYSFNAAGHHDRGAVLLVLLARRGLIHAHSHE